MATNADQVVRYCPECGSIGPIGSPEYLVEDGIVMYPKTRKNVWKGHPMTWLLYEHEDGRFAAAPNAETATFTLGDPGWHRVGPVEMVTAAAIHASQPFTFHWLVELRPAFDHHPPFQATYYAGWMEHPLEATKTHDPLAAVRFARKEDAERVAGKLGHTLSCVWKAVEHGFATAGVTAPRGV